MTHEEFMRRAIELAMQCQPRDPKRTPKLGVVIAREGIPISQACRGTGVAGDDDHAELIAYKRTPVPEQITGSTVYTTLEPCTHHTRRSTSEACTDLLIRLHVAKVFIGILDPNQGVCGRGFNQLQEADIEVEMFPHNLAREVRLGNAEFIQAQQTYSPTILTPKSNDVFFLPPGKNGGYYAEIAIEFKCNLPPDLSICIIVQDGANWWPSRWPISKIGDNRYTGKVGIGAIGIRTIHIVKANGFGMATVNYFKAVHERNEQRMAYLRDKLTDSQPKEFWDAIPSNYQGLKFNELPNGLDTLASVTIEAKPQM